MGLSAYTASLISASMSTFLFGIYTSIAWRCSLALWYRYKSSRKFHLYVLVTHGLLVVLVTMRCLGVLVDVIKPAYRGTFTVDDPWQTSGLFTSAVWMITVLVSDAFITYRSYIVWAKNIRIIVIPVLLVLANVALMIVALLGTADKPNPLTLENIGIYFDKYGNNVERFVIITLIVNVANTGLIAFRIWNVRRKTLGARIGNDSLKGLVSLLIESAAVYTVVLVIHLIFVFISDSKNATDAATALNLIHIAVEVQPPMIGIVFSTIIASIARGEAFGDSTSGETDGVNASVDRITWPRSRPGATIATVTEINMQTIITTRVDPEMGHESDSGNDFDNTKKLEV